MELKYIAQPDSQLGYLLLQAFAEDPLPKEIVIVSAFVSLQAIMRLKSPVSDLRTTGCSVRFVIGVDMGGTSKEVLQELNSWGVTVSIVKNRLPGHTFHPKVYTVSWDRRVMIIVGSNNLTEGGLFRNYEAAALVNYEIPADKAAVEKGFQELKRFLEPSGETCKTLDDEYLALLLLSKEIPSEKEARERDRAARVVGDTEGPSKSELFGREDFPPPPPLPAKVLEGLVIHVNERRKEARKKALEAKNSNAEKPQAEKKTVTAEGDPSVIEELEPSSFYMTLPTLQGDNIPGESRIPLAAIEMAEEFWGWPEKYQELKTSPRGGVSRVYHDWKPLWAVMEFGQPSKIVEVRMYMYDNSSDFRFYARPLVNAGADSGDLVRITRIAQPEAEFECVLAKKGSATYKTWIKYCTVKVRNSDRSFGYG